MRLVSGISRSKGCQVTQVGFSILDFGGNGVFLSTRAIPLLTRPFQGSSNDIQHVIDRGNPSALPYTLYTERYLISDNTNVLHFSRCA